MAEHQAQLVCEMAHHNRDAQAAMMRDFHKAVVALSNPNPTLSSPLSAGKTSWCPLTKLGPDDEIEAYLETFERTAEAAQWPRDQWAHILGPYLTGEAQAAVRTLSKQDAASYKAVKEAILDRYEVTPETSRQKFRSIVWQPPMRPRALAATLKDAPTRWLQPTTDDGRRVLDLVVVEQFLQVIPSRARHWVACSKPASLKAAVKLWENFIAAEGSEKRDIGRGQPSGPRTTHGGPIPRPSSERGGRARTPLPRTDFSNQGTRGHGMFAPEATRDPPRPADGGPTPRTNTLAPGPCFRCGQWGPFKKECPLMECDYGRDWTMHAHNPGSPTKPVDRSLHGRPLLYGFG